MCICREGGLRSLVSKEVALINHIQLSNVSLLATSMERITYFQQTLPIPSYRKPQICKLAELWQGKEQSDFTAVASPSFTRADSLFSELPLPGPGNCI